MATAVTYRRQCAEAISAYSGTGYFHGRPWLRVLFEDVPRELFTPDRVWWHRRDETGRYPVLDRHRQPDEWLKAVYTPDAALITQIADGAVRIEDGPTEASDFTASISCPAVVVDMLGCLSPRPGQRILEIGTGTGYSTALMARRIGPSNVVSVENQPTLAERAERNLKRDLGRAPLIVTADGEEGYLPRAPYDGVLSTACVYQVPPAWLQQTKAGGVIVTPLATPWGPDSLVRLVCDGQGGADGELVKPIYFMKVRGQRERLKPWKELGWPLWSSYRISVAADGPASIRTAP